MNREKDNKNDPTEEQIEVEIDYSLLPPRRGSCREATDEGPAAGGISIPREAQQEKSPLLSKEGGAKRLEILNRS